MQKMIEEEEKNENKHTKITINTTKCVINEIYLLFFSLTFWCTMADYG